MEVEICSSCIARSCEVGESSKVDLNEFLEAVRKELSQAKPDEKWSVVRMSCQRFCPPQRLTMAIANQMAMSSDTSVAGVVKTVLSYSCK